MAVAITFTALTFADPNELVNWWLSITGERRTANRSSINPQTLTKAAAPKAPTGNDASVSKDPMSLILVASDPGESLADGIALIGTSADSPQTYKVGAILTNGARIAEIKGDHVMLTRDALQERLYQEDVPLSKRIAQGPAVLARVGGPRPFTPAEPTVQDILTDYIRPNPVSDRGVLTGFEVYPGKGAGVFTQLGLKPGDVVVSLNGVPLSNAQVAFSYFETLTQGAVMNAVVLRKGERLELSLNGALIVEAERTASLPPLAPPLAPLP